MSESTFLFLEPLDYTFFRTPRPFFAAEVATARSTFPLPQVTYGAVRTMVLLDPEKGCIDLRLFGSGTCDGQEGCPRKEKCRIPPLIGTPDRRGGLAARGPLLAHRRQDGTFEIWLPAPRNLAPDNDTWVISNPTVFSDNDPFADFEADDLGLTPMLAAVETKTSQPGELLISAAGLRAFLRGQCVPGEAIRPLRDFFAPERRVGVGLDGFERTVAVSMLYTAEYRRPRPNTGFLIELQGLVGETVSWPAATLLGGERRAARVEMDPTINEWLPAPEVTGNRIRLCLATPAICRGGWAPSWLVPTVGKKEMFSRLPEEHYGKNGIEARLVAAAVGRPTAVGGFQLALRQGKAGPVTELGPRPIRLAAPAGSVYDLEIKGDPKEAAALLRARGISEMDQEAGFGLTTVGVWEPRKLGEVQHED